jgi:hypothetical protein
VNTDIVRRPGHSAEGDWDDPSDHPFNGLGTALLVVSTGVYFAVVWLLSGLAPLPSIASGIRWLCRRPTTRGAHLHPTPRPYRERP